ncbi:unnamed protein product [Meganyctiphanes norvegica]|uniref:C2H2-type domain-containing protein n=1 Tax=Meganyctiphanes norvegica TaxID=48144 RepID=A0AAV2S950_MEGNR
MDSIHSSLNPYSQIMDKNRHENTSQLISSAVSTANVHTGIDSQTYHQKLVASDVPAAVVSSLEENMNFTHCASNKYKFLSETDSLVLGQQVSETVVVSQTEQHQQQQSQPLQILHPSHMQMIENDKIISSIIVPEHLKEEYPEDTKSTIATPKINSKKVKNEEKNEKDSNADFIEAAYDIFLKVSNKEMTIKAAADTLGRPYFFVYSRYQEFCDQLVDNGESDKKIKRGKRKKRRIRLTLERPGRNRSNKKIYQCEECPAKFYREIQLKSHFKVHTEENESHKCTACGLVFPKLTKLMKHRIDTHRDVLKCPHCESQFTNIQNYQFHIRIHTGEKNYPCDECGKMFTHPSNLRVHRQRHNGEKPFMCGVCGKTFFTLGNLKSHRYVHTGGKRKPYACEICGQRYIQKSTLDTHMVVHTGDRPYSCRFCDKRFAFRSNMLHHEMLHTGEQPFQCDLCPAKFCQSIALKRHKIAHTGQKPFKCDLCDYACTRKRNLDLHMYTHTGETPFKCDFYGCQAEFARPRELKKHALLHGPSVPVACKVCGQQFTEAKNLNKHMITHTGQKPYTCEECFKTCINESSLKRHMYKHMYKPEGQKQKQVRHPKKNSVSKKNAVLPNAVTTVSSVSSFVNPVQVNASHNSLGHSLSTAVSTVSGTVGHYTWNINTAETNNQPQFSSITTNVWPSSIDPDDFRRRLMQSFK